MAFSLKVQGLSGFHPGFFNWGGGGGSISGTAASHVTRGVCVCGGGGGYASTDFIGPVGSGALPIMRLLSMAMK